MDGNPAQQAFKELLPYLETLETQTAAILQLLKDKGLTTDEQFASYLEQAGNISNVKWLAARLRIDRLLSSVDKHNEEDARKTEASSGQASAVQENSTRDSEQNEENRETEKTAASGEDQSDRKNRETGDTKTAKTKQGQETKDNADQEKAESTPTAKSAKPAENRGKEDSDKQMKKESNSNANADRDTERNTEKKAS
jgi:hypothetical protein